MAQFAANPTEDHLSHALYICHYLVGTPNYRLRYDGASGQGLNACTDSDWASDVNTPRSTSGYFIKFAGGLISWTTKAQKTVRADLGSHLKYSQRWSGVRAGVLLGAQGAVHRGESRGGL